MPVVVKAVEPKSSEKCAAKTSAAKTKTTVITKTTVVKTTTVTESETAGKKSAAAATTKTAKPAICAPLPKATAVKPTTKKTAAVGCTDKKSSQVEEHQVTSSGKAVNRSAVAANKAPHQLSTPAVVTKKSPNLPKKSATKETAKAKCAPTPVHKEGNSSKGKSSSEKKGSKNVPAIPTGNEHSFSWNLPNSEDSETLIALCSAEKSATGDGTSRAGSDATTTEYVTNVFCFDKAPTLNIAPDSQHVFFHSAEKNCQL